MRIFGATRIAPQPQLLPKHIRQDARMRGGFEVPSGCWERSGSEAFVGMAIEQEL